MGLSQAAQVNKPALSVGRKDRIVGGADLGTFFETEQTSKALMGAAQMVEGIPASVLRSFYLYRQ